MYLGLTAGLIDGQHHKRLGTAWMLFAWCVLRQTGQGKEGIVCRGSVLTYEGIASEMNCKKGSVREWMRRLVNQSYIRTERDRRGIRIFVRNPKKLRVSQSQHSQTPVTVGTSAGRVPESRHSKRAHPIQNKDGSKNLLQNDLTKHLKNNNTTAAPENGADHLFSLLGKAKSIPTDRASQAQIAERERFLLRQAKEVMAKYGGQPCA
jgi:hypothetical protein